MADPTTTCDVPLHVRIGSRLLEGVETVVCVGVADDAAPEEGGASEAQDERV